MNTDKYNNNPDAKNYSNCDISGSFYEVGVAKKQEQKEDNDKDKDKEQTQTQEQATAATACACVGTCAKKS